MIRDGFLKIASSVDMTGLLYVGLESFPHGLPSAGSPNVIELAGQRAVDKGQGYPLIARFDVETTLTSADATLGFTFGIVVSSSADLSGLPATLAQTPPLFPAIGVLGGTSYELVVPKLPTLASIGRAYMGLCVTVTTTARAPGAALFSGGVLSAYVTLDTPSEVPLTLYPSGWSL